MKAKQLGADSRNTSPRNLKKPKWCEANPQKQKWFRFQTMTATRNQQAVKVQWRICSTFRTWTVWHADKWILRLTISFLSASNVTFSSISNVMFPKYVTRQIWIPGFVRLVRERKKDRSRAQSKAQNLTNLRARQARARVAKSQVLTSSVVRKRKRLKQPKRKEKNHRLHRRRVRVPVKSEIFKKHFL